MRFLPTALLSVLVLLLSGSVAAHANTISGTIYCGVSTSDASNTPAPGAAISGSVCATFNTGTINSDRQLYLRRDDRKLPVCV